MARMSTRKVSLKDGFYVAVRSSMQYQQSPILIRRNTKEEAQRLLMQYAKSKNAYYYGEVRGSEVVE